MIYGREKSDSAIVAVKPANNVERSAAEPVEPRVETKGNVGQQSTHRTQSRVRVSQALDCIRQVFAVRTRGKSRMRESCTYGSVRGARGNSRPYRDRRAFITLLGGATAWPLVGRAQQPVIGWLGAASPSGYLPYLTAFHQGLDQTGYIEGRNVAIEYRWAEGQYERVPALAADLVHRQVAAIATSGGENPALAAKAATATIPIVFVVGSDPVKMRLVASLARPGGNATGVNIFTLELVEKRVGLLLDLIPTALSIAILVNPDFVPAMGNAKDAEAAIRGAGKQ